MDPQYSVLLGDQNSEDCIKTESKKGFDPKIIAIIIPTVVGAILIAGLLIYFYPKYALIIFYYKKHKIL